MAKRKQSRALLRNLTPFSGLLITLRRIKEIRTTSQPKRPRNANQLANTVHAMLTAGLQQCWQRNIVPDRIGWSMPSGGRSAALAASAILLSLSAVSRAPLDARAEEAGRQNATGYPAVEDVPPRPEKPAMTADEQLKLKKELSAARDRQAPKGKASGGARQPVKP
jgi:hypothetical protein